MSSPAPVRLDVAFRSGDAECAAWLYVPDVSGPAPAIVMAHGLGGVREMRMDAFAERFCAAGYACLVFDYRHFGASGGQPRQLLSVRRQLADWRAAVAFARERPEIDPDRVVVWGTSFGGGHAIVTAAEDPRLAAAIAQCPFTDGLASSLAVDPLTSAKVTVRAVRDRLAASAGRPPVMVPTAGPRHSTALMTAPDAVRGLEDLIPDDLEFADEVAARVAIEILVHHPGRRTRDVACPILFCVCDSDTVAPAKATLRHAAKAPRGEVRRYPDGHFAIYVGDAFERVVADQLAFLREHVPVAAPAA